MPKLRGYTCPECEFYHRQVSGAEVRNKLQIRCESCGNVESFVPAGSKRRVDA